MALSEDKDIFRGITPFEKLMEGNNPDIDLVNGNMYTKHYGNFSVITREFPKIIFNIFN